MENFGGIASRSGGDPGQAEVVFVPAPFEGSVSYGGGTAAGPAAILEASLQVETRDEETGVDLEDLSFAVAPAVVPEGSDPEKFSARLQAAVAGVVAAGKVPFVLGGEHSVTIGAVRGARAHEERVGLLSIDAHADLRDSYEGSSHSHACVVRRLLESETATIVGVRSYSSEEAAFAADNPKVTLVSARAAMAGSFSVPEFVATLPPRLWVTVDVDGFDPSVVPATGTPEPGGLSWWSVLDLLREVFARRTVIGMDVVELAPAAGSHVSEFATARLVAKMLTYREMGKT